MAEPPKNGARMVVFLTEYYFSRFIQITLFNTIKINETKWHRRVKENHSTDQFG